MAGFRVDFEGEPANVTVVRDVTDEREARTALATSEVRRKAILEASLEAVISMDHRGLVTGVNPAAVRIFGYSRAEAVGRRVSDLFIPAPWQEAHRIGLERFLATGIGAFIGRRVEVSGRRADGVEFPVELAIVRVDVEGPPLFAAFIRDLTEHKALERARERAAALVEENHRVLEVSRLKSEFLANMSHEVRTPLNAIVGFADLLHAGEVGPISEQQRESLDAILVSSRHLLRLITDVLDLAKVESGKLEFHPEPVDLRPIVHEVVGILGPAATRKEIAIETELDTLLTGVVVDPARLRQVLYNYLSNAVKFTDRGGRITVRTRADGERGFRIEVEDTGSGIRAQDMGRLFVEFQQLDAGLSKKHGGTGMGLALTKRLVEAQGGYVGAASQPGRGSTFYAVLPLAPPVAARLEGQEQCRRS